MDILRTSEHGNHRISTRKGSESTDQSANQKKLPKLLLINRAARIVCQSNKKILAGNRETFLCQAFKIG
jgi:hypothetical protein